MEPNQKDALRKRNKIKAQAPRIRDEAQKIKPRAPRERNEAQKNTGRQSDCYKKMEWSQIKKTLTGNEIQLNRTLPEKEMKQKRTHENRDKAGSAGSAGPACPSGPAGSADGTDPVGPAISIVSGCILFRFLGASL